MDVDQLKVTGEIRGWIFSGNYVPLQFPILGIPQGTTDVQAASFGRKIPCKYYDVLYRDRKERVECFREKVKDAWNTQRWARFY